MPKIAQNRIIISSVIAVLVTVILSIGIFIGLFEQLHLTFSDSLYRLNSPSEDIIIVKVDDKSVQPVPEGFGRYSQWTRDNFAKTLDRISQDGPSVVALDFIFNTPTTSLPVDNIRELEYDVATSPSSREKLNKYQEFIEEYSSSVQNPIDDRLAEEFGKVDKLILGAEASGDRLIAPLLKFSIGANLGITNNFPDNDGVFRRATPYFNIGDETYDDFAVAIAKKHLNYSELQLPLENEKLLVNYFGEPYSYRSISFVDVAKGNFDKNLFKDKIVLIGPTSSKTFHDEHLTPRSNTTPMPGVEFRANEIQTILTQSYLKNQSTSALIITVLLISVLFTTIFNYLKPIVATVALVGALAIYVGLAHFFYRQGIIVNMVYPPLAIVSSYIAAWVYRYFIADRKKREIKSAFGHYVSETLVEEISKNPDMVKLGGEKRQITVFFSDIKNSTTISEKTEITQWVSQMNEYFTVMESVIKKHQGTIDKYEGDAIMGFWNAPVIQKNHTQLAYQAALDMQQVLAKLNAKWSQEGRPQIEFRMGINTGEAIVGNFGSENRFDYTAMGDTVNTASRLESAANKTYGTSIMVAGQPKDLQGFTLREIDSVLLPGKTEPIQIHELLAKTPENVQLAQSYSKALQAYRKNNLSEAVQLFKPLAEKGDTASKVLLDRAQKLQSGQVIPQLKENMVFQIINK